jgi:hypothetical protein
MGLRAPHIPNLYRPLLVVGVLALPAVLTYGLVTLHVGASLSDYIPVTSDKIVYWSEIQSFKQVGFGAGYYTFDEDPARLAFIHFDAHGPVFPALYGLLARVFGWDLNTAPWFDLVLVTGALGVFVAIVQPDGKQLAATAVIIATCWPLLLYLPMTNQESLHHALALILAALFYRLIQCDGAVNLSSKILLFGCLLLATALRYFWAPLFIPFLVLSVRQRAGRRLVFAVTLALVLMAGMLALQQVWTAPYPYRLNPVLRTLRTSIPGSLRMFAELVIDNLEAFNHGHAFEIVQRYQILLAIFLGAAAGLILRRNPARKPALSGGEILFHLLNLGPVLLVNLLLYDMFDFRDWRAMAPHLLVTLLLLVAFWRMWVLVPLIALSLVALPQFMDQYKTMGDEATSTYERASYTAFEDILARHIHYESDQDAWCNTLLVPVGLDFPYELTAVPPGIGLSFAFSIERVDLPVKSRYLLLDDPTYEVWQRRLNVDRLDTTTLGSLYLNLDADCAENPAQS